MELADLLKCATDWLKFDSDLESKTTIRSWIAEQDQTALLTHFNQRLRFGTAGLRGPLGPGPNAMNSTLIRIVCEGLSRVILNGSASRSVVIGYDGRHGSYSFAKMSARVLASRGIAVHLSDKVCPTPLLSYCVNALNADAGIMVTASHNPPKDNGFKVYWSNGAQIIPPQDQQISNAIDEVWEKATLQEELPTIEDFDTLKAQGKVIPLDPDIENKYIADVLKLRVYNGDTTKIKIVYTAMHGVGYALFNRVLDAVGYSQLLPVESQVYPDPDFPTVAFPNPEEPGALDLACELAKRTNATIVLAHDPDADRLAVMARDHTNELRAFTGDQIGALIAHELFTHVHPSALDMVATTIVSSNLLSVMATEEKVRFAETLTGFKWIANQGIKHLSEVSTDGGRFLFGYEEAIGFSLGGLVCDKDGISAGLFLADMAARAHAQNLTLWDKLAEIYQRYGLYLSALRSRVRPGISGAKEIAGWMHALRQNVPTHIGTCKVIQYTDFLKRDDILYGNVLRFQLEGGARVIARPSGTEPKIKFYFEWVEPFTTDESLDVVNTRGAEQLNRLIHSFESYIDSLDC